MTKRGLDNVRGYTDERVATKVELSSLRKEMREGFNIVNRCLAAVQEDLREVKVVLPPLSRTVSQMELGVAELRKHLSRLERKVGLAK